MSARVEVLLWAQRVVGRKAATPTQILDLPAGAGADAAQEAFHKIARMAHPDLHRNGLTADELELVTTAYARAAAAYQELRGRPTTAPPPRSPTTPPARGTTAPPPRGSTAPPPRGSTAPPPRAHRDSSGPTAGAASDLPLAAAQSMSSKALVYYRKAEASLRRGELTGAVLQLKLAIAADPQATLLRSALAEVQAELGKK
jgi:hypothetical protein